MKTCVTNFVDLVNQDERVFCLYFLEALDDLSGHRTHVGPSMTFDLRYICHTSHTEPEILHRKWMVHLLLYPAQSNPSNHEV